MSPREWLTLYRCGGSHTSLVGLPLTGLVVSVLANAVLLVLLAI